MSDSSFVMVEELVSSQSQHPSNTPLCPEGGSVRFSVEMHRLAGALSHRLPLQTRSATDR